MTIITTDVLAGAIRAAAITASTTEEQRVLNFAAGQFERLNADNLRLLRELGESETRVNRLRRTSKELQEENQRLRTDHEETFMYAIMTPDGRPYFDEFCVCEDRGLLEDEIYYLNEDMADGEPKYSVVPLYAAPVPPTASQPPIVPDECKGVPAWTFAENVDPRRCYSAGWNACRGAMLQSATSGLSAITSEHRRVIEMLLKVCGCAFELMDDGCQMEVDGEPSVVVPYESAHALSDALDEIENTLPDQENDRPNIVLAWSAVPRAALKSLLQLPADFRKNENSSTTTFREKTETSTNSPVIPDGCSHRIKPALPERDHMGFWSHPDRPETPFDEGSTLQEMRTWYAERGMEVDFTYMNQFFCGDCVYDANDAGVTRHWNPTPPEGEGWILLCIFDTEDGAAAEWVRYKDGAA
ncbi:MULTISPECIES: hypothetical protein [Brenneria]|uniref:DUF551 domain-containing protein n=1 Tax=Brenneria nigrifluens DSM 30175 = ATCC 13028 TaxID=1121120 RepID=A0A2U1UV13_9GAMM|nr:MULTISPECIES: hypothetical protein [Brenneria]EHD22091.1 hypothetical protein BrE312_2715 [Brenneria sp. EniD312]PWC25421.1 hypothetical protein DDT54_05865 [Brenneria nigrifluens DSM 30175 = ATCC 13028]QCR05171.1 hypothetical protein EH206_13820 [Brenneria nigrifluens DSM 30175 = ATCC 13028]